MTVVEPKICIFGNIDESSIINREMLRRKAFEPEFKNGFNCIGDAKEYYALRRGELQKQLDILAMDEH